MSGSKVRHIDFNASDWLSGTRGLGWDETAVYITVIAIIYDRGSACPNDAVYIAGQIARPGGRNAQAMAGSTRRTHAALARLLELGKLHLSPDGQWLTNGRADAELGKANGRIIGAARAGIVSGVVRRARAKGHARTAHPQRTDSAQSRGDVLSNSNGLARTPVRNHQPPKILTDHKTITDPAREPSPEPQASQARAPTAPEPEPGSTADRVARLARERRAKLSADQPAAKPDPRLAAAAAKARAKLMGQG